MDVEERVGGVYRVNIIILPLIEIIYLSFQHNWSFTS